MNGMEWTPRQIEDVHMHKNFRLNGVLPEVFFPQVNVAFCIAGKKGKLDASRKWLTLTTRAYVTFSSRTNAEDDDVDDDDEEKESHRWRCTDRHISNKC